MSVNEIAPSIIFEGNGETTEYTIPFPFINPENVKVTYVSADGYRSVWTYGVEYTIETVGDITDSGFYEEGRITLTEALADKARIALRRCEPYEQLSEYPTQTLLDPKQLEKSFDQMELQIQQLSDIGERAVTIPEGEDIDLEEFYNGFKESVDSAQANANEAKQAAESAQTASAKVESLVDTAQSLVDDVQSASESATSQISSSVDSWQSMVSDDTAEWSSTVSTDSSTWQNRVSADIASWEARVEKDKAVWAEETQDAIDSWNARVTEDMQNWDSTTQATIAQWEQSVQEWTDVMKQIASECITNIYLYWQQVMGEFKILVEESIQEWNDLVVESKAEWAQLVLDSLEQLEQATDSHLSELETAKNEHLSEMETAKDSHLSEMESAKESHLQELEEKTEECKNEIQSTTDEVVQKVQDKGDEMISALEDKEQELSDTLTQEAQKHIEDIQTSASEAKEDLQETINSANSTKEDLQEAINNATEVNTTLTETIASATDANTKLEEAVENATDITDTINNAEEVIENAANEAVENINSAVEQGKSDIDSTVSSATENITNIINAGEKNITQIIEQAQKDLEEAIANVQAGSTYMNLPSDMSLFPEDLTIVFSTEKGDTSLDDESKFRGDIERNDVTTGSYPRAKFWFNGFASDDHKGTYLFSIPQYSLEDVSLDGSVLTFSKFNVADATSYNEVEIDLSTLTTSSAWTGYLTSTLVAYGYLAGLTFREGDSSGEERASISTFFGQAQSTISSTYYGYSYLTLSGLQSGENYDTAEDLTDSRPQLVTPYRQLITASYNQGVISLESMVTSGTNTTSMETKELDLNITADEYGATEYVFSYDCLTEMYEKSSTADSVSGTYYSKIEPSESNLTYLSNLLWGSDDTTVAGLMYNSVNHGITVDLTKMVKDETESNSSSGRYLTIGHNIGHFNSGLLYPPYFVTYTTPSISYEGDTNGYLTLAAPPKPLYINNSSFLTTVATGENAVIHYSNREINLYDLLTYYVDSGKAETSRSDRTVSYYHLAPSHQEILIDVECWFGYMAYTGTTEEVTATITFFDDTTATINTTIGGSPSDCMSVVTIETIPDIRLTGNDSLNVRYNLSQSKTVTFQSTAMNSLEYFSDVTLIAASRFYSNGIHLEFYVSDYTPMYVYSQTLTQEYLTVIPKRVKIKIPYGLLDDYIDDEL